MTIDNRPRVPGLPRRKWQRPWITKEELRHDEAIQFPAPNILTGEMLTINFLTNDHGVQMMFGSGCIGVVTDERLIKDLFAGWLAMSIANPAEKVNAVQHVAFTGLWFIPVESHTRRAVFKLLVDSGIKLMTFWVRPRATVVAAGRNGSV